MNRYGCMGIPAVDITWRQRYNADSQSNRQLKRTVESRWKIECAIFTPKGGCAVHYSAQLFLTILFVVSAVLLLDPLAKRNQNTQLPFHILQPLGSAHTLLVFVGVIEHLFLFLLQRREAAHLWLGLSAHRPLFGSLCDIRVAKNDTTDRKKRIRCLQIFALPECLFNVAAF